MKLLQNTSRGLYELEYDLSRFYIDVEEKGVEPLPLIEFIETFRNHILDLKARVLILEAERKNE